MCIELYDYQKEAIEKLHKGCILCGGVGSGKSRTSLAYYSKTQGLSLKDIFSSKGKKIKSLYIITTARKRDTLEWDSELIPFHMSTNTSLDIFCHEVFIDSWNNISKYVEVKDAFFIFDEQRVVGKGAWVKSFLKITKNNDWILLSATPGDTWNDYVPVFIANGYFKNRTEFNREHVVFSPYTKFPSIDRYLNTGKLVRLRNNILVNMNYEKHSVLNHIDISVDYDHMRYKRLMKERWNVETQQPIENSSELCYELRKIVNSDETRQERLLDIFASKDRVIVFYNFDYELDILKSLAYIDSQGNVPELAEWNGHKHQPIPESNSWIYLVQYNAGAEGWNCIKTDTIVFFSQNYSYKMMVQASGRIDRLNTPFHDLYFYHFKSHSPIDLAIARALKSKQKFNEQKFIASAS